MKLLKLFTFPTRRELALRELEEAMREHLKACSAVEYASAMVTYNEHRIQRLEDVLASKV
jgi:hypothetical protein